MLSDIWELPLFWNAEDPTEAGEDTFMRWMLIFEKLAYGPSVINRNQASPTGSEVLGDMYQVSTSPTGIFSGHANEMALYLGNKFGWIYLPATEGLTVYDESLDNHYVRKAAGGWDVLVEA
jgi:Protein of unknown function (DUF2793).